MEISTQPKLQFRGIDVIETHFSCKKRFNDDIDIPIQIKVVPKVFYPKENKRAFSIFMNTFVTVEDYFDLNVRAVGHFVLDGDITSEIKLTFINTNAPAIMFPYLRSFISTFTSNLGTSIKTLTIPPQFFKGNIESIEGEEE